MTTADTVPTTTTTADDLVTYTEVVEEERAKAKAKTVSALPKKLTTVTADPELALMSLMAEHLAGFGPKTALQVAMAFRAIVPVAVHATEAQSDQAVAWIVARAAAAANRADRVDKKPEPVE